MALPNLSDADRKKALEKAAQARQQRAQLRQDLKTGKKSAGQVLSSTGDPIVARMKVRSLLESLPGFGKAKAAKMMEELDISPTRRVQGLGTKQKEQLLAKISS
ncbi:MAG: integration host factor [Actinobacteria bacterium]|nr:MAG: integration host factor [Actinomycetota bacterium]